MEGWHEFFLGQVGAAAALGGLVFVGVSINLGKIMASAHLPNRAQESLMLLLAILILSSLALVPNLATAGFGAETLGVGAAAWLGGTILHVRTLRLVEREYRRAARASAILGQLVTLTLLAAGLLMALGQDAGPYVLAGGMMAAYFLTFIHAWVLLVEINR
jgi:modulator of FtsH protease